MSKFADFFNNLNNLMAGNTDVPVSVSIDKETLFPLLAAVLLAVFGGIVLVKKL